MVGGVGEPVKVHPEPRPSQRDGGDSSTSRGKKARVNVGVALRRAQHQQRADDQGSKGVLLSSTVDALRQRRGSVSGASSLRNLGDLQRSATIVDMHHSSIRSNLGKMRNIGRLFRGKASWKHGDGRYGAAAPPKWDGAAKLVRNVGDTVIGVAVSDDDTLFAVGSTNKKAIVYTTTDGEVVASFTAKAAINAVCFSGTGEETRVLTGTFNGDLQMWHVHSGAAEHDAKFGNEGDPIFGMSTSLGGSRLAVGGQSSHVVVYSITFPEVQSLGAVPTTPIVSEIARYAPTGTTLSLSLSADGATLCTGGEAKLVQLWTLHSAEAIEASRGKAMATFRCGSVIHSVSLSADADHLAVGLSDCTEVYQLHATLEPPPAADDVLLSSGAPPSTSGGEATILGRGRRPSIPGPRPSASVGDAKGLVRRLTCEPLLWLECPAQQGGVAFSSEGKLAVAGNHHVTVFDTISGGTLAKMPREARVRCVALTSTGSIVIVGGFDRTVTLHNVAAGTEMTHFEAADDIVRSVHMSLDASRLAIGSDKRGKGCVRLFDVGSHRLIGEWEHPKSVWCVRLAPDGSILAAAGYDMQMTVYDTLSLQVVCSKPYTSTRGPAFIWSMAFSLDSSCLALGCWSGNAHLYKLVPPGGAPAATVLAAAAPATSTALVVDGAPAPARAPPELVEAAVIARHDRVYAVALDANGSHLCVGGRDKTCALYAIGEGSSPTLVWSRVSDDFVYTVALSADLTYCVYGGTNKAAVVLDGRTGMQVCRINVPGTVWFVALLSGPTAAHSRLAIGGELPTITVYDVVNACDVLQLPTDEVTYSVAISSDALCFTNGNFASMYGKGGTKYAWRDRPSFGVVASLILTMLSSEEQLLHCMKLIVDAHPAVVNSRDPETGASLLQFVVSHANQAPLLDVLLSAKCNIGLQADSRGRTCLHAALAQGKWRSLQQLLEALRYRRFSIIPGSMRLVAECFSAIAHDYPLDFLHYVRFMPLDPEPEVLGDVDVFDVMLPSLILCGSPHRCPKGIWKEKLAQYSRSAQADGDAAPVVELSVVQSEGSETSSAHRRFVNGLRPPSLRKQLTGGLFHRHKRVSIAEPSQAPRAETSPGRRERSERPGSGTRVRPPSPELSSATPSARPPRPSTAQRLNSFRGPVSPAKNPSGERQVDPAVEMGYNKKSSAGLRAYRVPIENFAGIFDDGKGHQVAPLQLIIDAVESTREYSVFDSQLMKILIEFKWHGFARRAFLKEFCIYMLNLFVVLLFNLRASFTLHYTFDDVLGRTHYDGREDERPDGYSDGTPAYLMLVCFVWTSLKCGRDLVIEVRQMRLGGWAYWTDFWNWFDLFYVFGQASINALFCVRDMVPAYLIIEYGYNASETRRLSEALDLEPALGLHALHRPHGLHGLHAPFGHDGSLLDGQPMHAMRALRGRASGVMGDETGELDNKTGLFVYLQSLVCLGVCLRLLWFFRGSLRLSALTHSLGAIVVDILPLLILLAVFVVAFCAAAVILIIHELSADVYPEWHHFFDALLNMLNIGLYTYYTTSVFATERRFLLIVYQFYMILVQVILLNMLIAVMSQSHQRVSEQSELVALRGRAKLILEYETEEVARARRREKAQASRLRSRRNKGRFVGGALAGIDPARLLEEIDEGNTERRQRVCPRWLHVLMPADHQRGAESQETESLKQIKELKREVATMSSTISAQHQKLLEMVRTVK